MAVDGVTLSLASPDGGAQMAGKIGRVEPSCRGAGTGHQHGSASEDMMNRARHLSRYSMI